MGYSLYVIHCFPLAAFKNISLLLTFAISTTICLAVGLFGFILFVVEFSTSGTWVSVSLHGLGKFSAIISSNKVFVSFSLSSFGIHTMQMFVPLILVSWTCSFLKFFFPVLIV